MDMRIGKRGRTGIKPDDVVKRHMVKVRLNDAQMQAIRRKADDTGVSVSAVVRAILDQVDWQSLETNKSEGPNQNIQNR